MFKPRKKEFVSLQITTINDILKIVKVGNKMEKEMINIIDTSGNQLDVELISILEEPKENSRYLVYSKGEKQKNGNLILFISKIVNRDNSYVLVNIDDDEEWVRVKRLMSEIVSSYE